MPFYPQNFQVKYVRNSQNLVSKTLLKYENNNLMASCSEIRCQQIEEKL